MISHFTSTASLSELEIETYEIRSIGKEEEEESISTEIIVELLFQFHHDLEFFVELLFEIDVFVHFSTVLLLQLISYKIIDEMMFDTYIHVAIDISFLYLFPFSSYHFLHRTLLLHLYLLVLMIHLHRHHHHSN